MTDYFAHIKRSELCLDFVNSKVWDVRTKPFGDLFCDYDRVVHWCRHLDILDDDDVDRARRLVRLPVEQGPEARAARALPGANVVPV